MIDKQFLDELNAKEALRDKGYKDIKCSTCKGTGFDRDAKNFSCWRCEGKGYLWQAPITK